MSAPAPPPEATAIFGSRLPLAVEYADRLADEATVRGLIGPGEVPRLWSRHLLNCAVVGELIDPQSRVIDVGSGAGLPGVPLAIARPDLSVVLVEPLLRRAGWLSELIEVLGLTGSVEVVRARAEELVGRHSAAVVTARAVAPLGRLGQWCLPLVSPGGELLAMKGRTAQAELTAARDELTRLGAVDAEVVPVGVGRLLDPTSVVRVRVGTVHERGPGHSRPGRSSPRTRGSARSSGPGTRQRTEGGGR